MYDVIPWRAVYTVVVGTLNELPYLFELICRVEEGHECEHVAFATLRQPSVLRGKNVGRRRALFGIVQNNCFCFQCTVSVSGIVRIFTHVCDEEKIRQTNQIFSLCR